MGGGLSTKKKTWVRHWCPRTFRRVKNTDTIRQAVWNITEVAIILCNTTGLFARRRYYSINNLLKYRVMVCHRGRGGWGGGGGGGGVGGGGCGGGTPREHGVVTKHTMMSLDLLCILYVIRP